MMPSSELMTKEEIVRVNDVTKSAVSINLNTKIKGLVEAV